jgi:hypothetical protein
LLCGISPNLLANLITQIKMHGQKRAEYKARLLHPDTRAKLGSKAQQWNHLSEELLKQRRRLFSSPPPLLDNDDNSGVANDGGAATVTAPSPEVLLALTEKMLSVNPDPSHLWNIRREMLVYLMQTAPPSAMNNTSDDNQEDVDDDSSEKKSTFDIEAELKLTAHCLQRNPKSYSAWFHRKWALVSYFTSDTQQQEHWANMKSILRSELDLCVQFLQLDERNFHCWNFRRFVVSLLGSCGGGGVTTIENNGEVNDDAPTMSPVDNSSGSWSSWMHQIEKEDKEVLMGPQISQNACRAVVMNSSSKEVRSDASIAKSTSPLSKEELEKIIMNEWDFSTAKIQDNFSNGSAFHYRSKLLPLVLEFRSSGSASSPSEAYEAISLVRDEWDGILLDAIFTEPDDQTIWFYHRFIVSWAKCNIVDDGANAEVTEEFEGLLYDMVDSIQELIDVEKEDSLEDSTQNRHESKGAKCKWAYLGMHLVLSTLLEFNSSDDDDDDDDKLELRERAKGCLDELMIIDPDRRERYQILESELI